MVKKLIILCGLPASGKSTWIKNNYPDAPIVSNDLITEKFATDNNITYDEALKALWHTDTVRKETQKEFEKHITNNEPIVIIDNTHMTVRSRARFNPKGYEKHCVVFSCSEEETQERNKVRAKSGKFIPDSVFEQMRKIYVEPTHKEGFKTIKRVRT